MFGNKKQIMKENGCVFSYFVITYVYKLFSFFRENNREFEYRNPLSVH